MPVDREYTDSRAQRNPEHHQNKPEWQPLRDAVREIVLAVARKREGGE